MSIGRTKKGGGAEEMNDFHGHDDGVVSLLMGSRSTCFLDTILTP
jgi:hypothetical protein